ncbi:hypothetical protein HJG60_009988 [Phyllostomus discolor]|uniref:Uncharacterized protein n=1 Tax=Phyllostomus discolor TaxID=89673 RepID=A0A834ELL6_9CHIR|nr:hypothetical protein HJG60_009988 [Phyllostomus discolor]
MFQGRARPEASAREARAWRSCAFGRDVVNASPPSPSPHRARRRLRQTREDGGKGPPCRLSVRRPNHWVPVFALSSCPPVHLHPRAGPRARRAGRHQLRAVSVDTGPAHGGGTGQQASSGSRGGSALPDFL